MKAHGVAGGRAMIRIAFVVLAVVTTGATSPLRADGATGIPPRAACPTGQVICGGSCVDPGTDNAHCGAAADCQGTNAGTACKAGEVCAAGKCGSNCPAADPDDDKPDTKAIQECLDNPAMSTVTLARKRALGSPGLIIDNFFDRTNAALYLPKGKTLTSVGSGSCWTKDASGRYLSHDLDCALLVAKDNLSVNMVTGTGDGSTIDRLHLRRSGSIRARAHFPRTARRAQARHTAHVRRTAGPS
jgi:hypothetical protein